MPTGFVVGTVDLDDYFDPYVTGTKSAATGMVAGGADLSERYAPLAYGSAAAATGMKVGTADLNTLWAAKGTARYSISGLQGKSVKASDTALTDQPSVSASTYVSIASTGTWSVGGGTSRGAITVSAPSSGTWLPAGDSASDYQVQFVVTGSNGTGNVGNGATAYTALSASRSASLSLPSMSGANGIQRADSVSVTINLKKISTGQVTVTTMSMTVETVGYL